MIHEQLIEVLRDASHDLATTARNDHLQLFRECIGSHVYLGRVPPNVATAFCCVVKPVAMQRELGTTQERDLYIETVQIDIYANTFDAPTKVTEIAEHLRLALTSYTGTLNGVQISHAYIVREGMDSGAAVGGDGWEFRYSMDWDIASWQSVVSTTQ